MKRNNRKKLNMRKKFLTNILFDLISIMIIGLMYNLFLSAWDGESKARKSMIQEHIQQAKYENYKRNRYR